jgi:hypothetical protein
MPRDILIMTNDADGIRQLKLDTNACELRLPGLPSLRLGLTDLEFLASYLPMVADAAFARASVPPLFAEEENAPAARHSVATVAASPIPDRRGARPSNTGDEVIEDESSTEPSKVSDSKAGKRWSDEEEDRLRQFLLDGHSIPEVATRLKRSPGSVIARALLRGMIAVNVTPELVEQGHHQPARGSGAGSERRAA